MSNLTKEYKIEGMYDSIHIFPNYDNDKLGYKSGSGDVIFLEKINSDEDVSFSINQAKEIVNALVEIIDTVENYIEPIIGDSVTILDGQFQGMAGRIVDIDTVAKERELVVKIDKTEASDEFYAYIDMDNVE